MSDSAIWLLVADEQNANIYVSQEGCSRLLRTVVNTAMPPAALWTDGMAGANVVPLQGHAAVPRDERERRRDFAFQLIAVLYEAAETGACDGIIIVATRVMTEALRRVRPLVVSKLLIAEMVEETPGDLANAMLAPADENSTAAVNPTVTALRNSVPRRANNPFAKALKR